MNGSEAAELATVDCIIWDEVCMTDYRIMDAVHTLFKHIKNSTLPFSGVMMVMGEGWRQILPIMDGVKGHGVTQCILKRSTMWDDVEKSQLTENKRAQSDPEYAKKFLMIGDGTNYIDGKGQMIYIYVDHIERRSYLQKLYEALDYGTGRRSSKTDDKICSAQKESLKGKRLAPTHSILRNRRQM